MHHLKLPQWPEVDIMDKTIDGLVPSTRIESWEQFNSVINGFGAAETSDEYIFRGQHHYKWFLEPSLDRYAEKAIDSDLAAKQLKYFRLAIRGRMLDGSLLELRDAEDDHQDIELWAVGQHHGLATPLLDWTLSPYVALFFSFVDEDRIDWVDEKGDPTNSSRSVFFLNKTFLEDLEEPVERKYPRIVEPAKDDYGRLVNQAGLFTIAPYGETLESSLLKALADSKINIEDPGEVGKYLCKVHVPNSTKERQECLRQLRKMNIHHASLFPDLIGASGYCNELTREYIVRRSLGIKSKEAPKREVEFWKAHELPVGAAGLKPLVDALLINDSVKSKMTPADLTPIAKSIVEFVNTKAGIDWWVRDSQLARLRTFVRRGLSRTSFDEDAIPEAATNVVSVAASLSRESAKAEDASATKKTKRKKPLAK